MYILSILVFTVGVFVCGMGVGVKLQQHAIRKTWEESE